MIIHSVETITRGTSHFGHVHGELVQALSHIGTALLFAEAESGEGTARHRADGQIAVNYGDRTLLEPTKGRKWYIVAKRLGHW